MKRRHHKYGAKPQYVINDRGPIDAARLTAEQKKQLVKQGAIYFHSKKEAERWLQLRFLEKINEISNLRRQEPFELTIKVKYCADFVYDDPVHGPTVEDSKGMRTREFKQKKKAFLNQHPDYRFLET